MLSYSAPPWYRRTMPVRRPKLEEFTAVIDAILSADRDVPRKQRHTAQRIFERLRDEHGFTGGYTIVKDYVRAQRQSTREAFVPLHHPPGHAQADFGQAVVDLRGKREKVHFFCFILPHSNAWFVKAYPRPTPCQRRRVRDGGAQSPSRPLVGRRADPSVARGRPRARPARRSSRPAMPRGPATPRGISGEIEARKSARFRAKRPLPASPRRRPRHRLAPSRAGRHIYVTKFARTEVAPVALAPPRRRRGGQTARFSSIGPKTRHLAVRFLFRRPRPPPGFRSIRR